MLIELPFPIVPRTEIASCARALDELEETIEKVLKYQLYCGIGFNGECEFYEKHASTRLTGSEALVRLAELKGVTIPTVQDFEVPDQLFLKTPSLFDLATTLESRLWRVQILSELAVPELVMKNEKHALCIAVWKLLEFPISVKM